MAKKLPRNSKKLNEIDSLINKKLEGHTEEIKLALHNTFSSIIEEFGRQFHTLDSDIRFYLSHISFNKQVFVQRDNLIHKIEQLLKEEKNVV